MELGLKRRWRAGRLPPELKRQVRQDLASGMRAVRRREAKQARQILERAHRRAQNDPLRHALCHLSLGLCGVSEGRPGAAASELRLAVAAVPASVLRRLVGLRPGQDNGPGLWPTFRDRAELRRRPPAAL